MNRRLPLKYFSRRRAIAVIGATAVGAIAGLSQSGRTRAATATSRWRGVALGAEAEITIVHENLVSARSILRQCVAEIRRLEHVFSLFDPNSELVRLNAHGRLAAPSHDLVALLSSAQRYGSLTGGAFDVTVQPLWRLVARQIARRGSILTRRQIETTARLVDYRAMELGSKRIAFAGEGMAVTLNGIAQGYITDRVADLLRNEGLDSVLVSLGEFRAAGAHPSGRPWAVGLSRPGGRQALFHQAQLTEEAIATSAGAGLNFDPSGRYHHILDPATGTGAMLHASVSVIAPRAIDADALSTALCLVPWVQAPRFLTKAGGRRAIVLGHDGGIREAHAS